MQYGNGGGGAWLCSYVVSGSCVFLVWLRDVIFGRCCVCDGLCCCCFHEKEREEAGPRNEHTMMSLGGRHGLSCTREVMNTDKCESLRYTYMSAFR